MILLYLIGKHMMNLNEIYYDHYVHVLYLFSLTWLISINIFRDIESFLQKGTLGNFY